MERSHRSAALGQKVGVAAAMSAAFAMGCSSDSSPEPTGQADAAAEGSDALSELFQEGSPEDVAQQLEAMVDAGEEGSDGSGGSAGSAPLYKGITFS